MADESTDDKGTPDPTTAVAALTAKYGDVQRAAERLYEINERLTKKVERLEKRPELPEGARIVSKDEAADLDAYKALGKPADVKAKVEKLPTVEASLVQRDREVSRDVAAKALGIEGKALASFVGADALTYETREEEVEANGKKEKRLVPYVKDSAGKEHRLADYGKATWPGAFEAVIGAATANPAPTGTTYTTQTGGSGKPGSAYDPAAEGKKMAEQTLANKTDKSLAFR